MIKLCQDVEIRITAIRGLGATARHLSVEPPAALVAALEDEAPKSERRLSKPCFAFSAVSIGRSRVSSGLWTATPSHAA